MKNLTILFVILFFSCSNLDKQENHRDIDFQLELGDILFQDLDSSPLCDAIELVTPGYREANFSHIGIITEIGDPYQYFIKNQCDNTDYNYYHNTKVIEAIPNKVTKTRLDSFLNRSLDSNYSPKVIVGRLKPKYKENIYEAISFLNNKLNTEYDDEFLIDNDKYYCSELIYEAFQNDSIFQLRPMTFLHPKTNKPISTWTKYYKNLNLEIPEGELGINPGIMSLSNKIDIVHIYGKPEGMKN